jgi:hypothetical protein
MLLLMVETLEMDRRCIGVTRLGLRLLEISVMVFVGRAEIYDSSDSSRYWSKRG